MAFGTFQDVLDGVAQVVGGTAPDPTNKPRWFSGADSGDDTGITGINGCYSAPISEVTNAPVGYVMPGRFTLANPLRDTLTMGTELNQHDVRLRLIVPNNDPPTQIVTLAEFLDEVPAAFAAHQTLFSTANVYTVVVSAGDFVAVEIAGTPYMAYQFTVSVFRNFTRTYSA